MNRYLYPNFERPYLEIPPPRNFREGQRLRHFGEYAARHVEGRIKLLDSKYIPYQWDGVKQNMWVGKVEMVGLENPVLLSEKYMIDAQMIEDDGKVTHE